MLRWAPRGRGTRKGTEVGRSRLPGGWDTQKSVQNDGQERQLQATRMKGLVSLAEGLAPSQGWGIQTEPLAGYLGAEQTLEENLGIE